MKIMYSLIMLFFLSDAVFAAPSDQSAGPDPERLAKDPRFRVFAYNFLDHFTQWGNFYKMEKSGSPTLLIEAIQNSDGEERTVAALYAEHSLDFEEAMLRQNEADNDFFTLMVDFPDFQAIDDERTSAIIIEALTIVSKEPPTEMEVNKVLPPGETPGGLTVQEVWDCALEALGVGVGSFISIHAIKKLAAEKGVQAVVVSMSKLLAKRAGWIGAIAVLVDFSICLNTEAND